MKKEHLLAFAEAWSYKKIDEVMDCFTNDCVYKPSISKENEIEYSGKMEVREAIIQMMELDNSIASKVYNIYVNEDFGFWEWKYEKVNGEEVVGCDVFEFRGNKIISKNAFRKIEL